MIAQPDTRLEAEAWTQIYRMPGHQETRNRLAAARPILPQPARSFASELANLYDARINADYNPRSTFDHIAAPLLAPTCRDCNHRIPPNATGPTSRHRRHHPDPQALTTNATSTCLPTASPQVGSKTWQPIQESRPARRTFNTPNAAGVSRDTDAGPDSDQDLLQPASSTSQRRDANGTTACTTAAADKPQQIARHQNENRRCGVTKSSQIRWPRSWFFDDSRNRPLATHG